jgi:hypothetical protein
VFAEALEVVRVLVEALRVLLEIVRVHVCEYLWRPCEYLWRPCVLVKDVLVSVVSLRVILRPRESCCKLERVCTIVKAVRLSP